VHFSLKISLNMTSGGNNFSGTLQDLKLQFPGLSRTKVIFQDFPGPGILKKKSRTFQEAWEPCNTQPASTLYRNFRSVGSESVRQRAPNAMHVCPTRKQHTIPSAVQDSPQYQQRCICISLIACIVSQGYFLPFDT